MADGEHAHEMVIIKRHGDHEEGHHGGVWKIAFADFMTAMMAFFLVMWLISANDKTKATIASYFNPVKLVDTTTQPKGLEDAKAVESTEPSKKGAVKPAPAKDTPSKETPKDTPKETPKSQGENDKAGGAGEGASKVREKRLAAAVLDDPFAALTEIAGTKGTGDKSSEAISAKTAVKAVSRKGGDAFRDPFAPPPPLQPDTPTVPTDSPEADAKPLPPGGDPSVPLVDSGKDGTSGTEAGATDPGKGTAGRGATARLDAADPGADLKARILAAARGAGAEKGSGADKGPQVDVRKVEGGFLISLTDSDQFEMFSTGSALPGKKVVLMMDRIGQVLKSRPGKIVVRGYTDSRQYKAPLGHYDNWHLSLDRAQVTHYMLVRGGVDETRIAHVEGYADRNLRNTADPTSPVNRRIEILVMGDKP
jgi:chemotaxis protein MotB